MFTKEQINQATIMANKDQKKLMDKETFEDYLQEKHFEENPTLLDDDIPDAFNEWLENVDTQDVIEYADIFIKRVLEAKEKEVKEDIIKNIEGMKKEIPQFRGTLKQLDNLTNLIKK